MIDTQHTFSSFNFQELLLSRLIFYFCFSHVSIFSGFGKLWAKGGIFLVKCTLIKKILASIEGKTKEK